MALVALVSLVCAIYSFVCMGSAAPDKEVMWLVLGIWHTALACWITGLVVRDFTEDL
jgi:hypothetical protein